MTLSLDLILQLVIYLLGLAVLGGTVMTRLRYLEKKMDEHNKVVVRMYKVEQKVEQQGEWLSDLERKVH